MKIVKNNNAIIITLLVIICVLIVLLVLIYSNIRESNKIEFECGDVVISMTIVPSEVRSLSYRVDLHENGLLAVTVGNGVGVPFFDKNGHVHFKMDILRDENGEINLKDEISPILTMYRQLSDLEMKELMMLISNIKNMRQEQDFALNGGWYVAVTYRGETQYDDFHLVQRRRSGMELGEDTIELIDNLLVFDENR